MRHPAGCAAALLLAASCGVAHADAPAGPRLARPADLPGFLKSIGLDEAAPVPVHVFTGPGEGVFCQAGCFVERASKNQNGGCVRVGAGID